MPIHCAYSDNDLTIFTVVGEISFADVMVTLETTYNDNPTLNILWDIRQGTAANITYEHLVAIADFIVKVSGKRRGGKTALVALHDAEYGVSRTLETLASIKEIPFAMQVFREYAEACAWLQGD
jgi:hypothetical protein